MPAYNTNNANVDIDQNSQNVSTAIVAAMYKERRERLRDERRGSWLTDIVKKHDTKLKHTPLPEVSGFYAVRVI